MKAFVVAVILLVAITGAAAVSLDAVPMSSQDVFTRHDTVRL